MYNEDWEDVMTADSMDEKISAFADLAQGRAENREQPIEDVVHNLTHQSYLEKHTTSDILTELAELESLYPDAMYDGEANDHIMTYLDDTSDFEYWYDYAYLSLAAGLEWAVLTEIQE
ncbi:hypothetical protein ACFR99_18840 [Haloarchaeobius amylolyticus]|uniref:Uncharacterized protein n=1 Tax=Haloarchaeobius amylolyticus TaxID=1198296 RepID=A0ABD6BKV4_9EURY